MPTPPPEPTRVSEGAMAAAALDVLDRLTAYLRCELAEACRGLPASPASDAAQSGEARCAQLQEANEQLLHATLQAEQRANQAMAELEEATWLSQFDPLTELPNRTLMRDRLREALAMARRHDACLALLFVDLDGFKAVNDTGGHGRGDEVLKCMAARLKGAVRESDTVARHGGDEFLVLLPEVADRDAAAHIAQKMLQVVAEPVELGDEAVRLTASIGIALWPGDGDDSATLIDRADQAMYAAKRAGCNRYAFANAVVAAGSGAPPLRSSRDTLLRNLRDANEQLMVAALRAQELLDAAEFARDRHAQAVTVLAHELRNPLAPIRTAGQWLVAAYAGDPKLGKAGEVIERQTTHMTHLIDDLLDSARTRAGDFRLRVSSVALREVLERSIEAGQATLRTREQVLSVQLPPGTLRLQGDPMRLEQVFRNLLDNASKYTPAGGHISLSAEAQGGWARVTVSDDGIGIAPQALPHIFDLFVQAPSARAHDAQGLGIGLAVVRELVRAHGGTVEAHSEGPGHGSRFVVCLPCSVQAGAAARG